MYPRPPRPLPVVHLGDPQERCESPPWGECLLKWYWLFCFIGQSCTHTPNLQQNQDAELIRWINSHLVGVPHKATDLSISLSNGLVLFRLAEAIKGVQPGASEVPDSLFATTPEEADEKLDGLFALFDFLLDNDVRMGSVSINDVRQGEREKLVQLVKALKTWKEKRQSLQRSLSGRAVGTGPFIGAAI